MSTRRAASTLDHDCDELGGVLVAAYVHDPVDGSEPYIVVDVDHDTDAVKVTLNDGTIYDGHTAESFWTHVAEARALLDVDKPADPLAYADEVRDALSTLVAALDADA